jgi:hypothetical protein
VEKLLLEGKCWIERTEELKMFSLQLHVMKNKYKICRLFSLNVALCQCC